MSPGKASSSEVSKKIAVFQASAFSKFFAQKAAQNLCSLWVLVVPTERLLKVPELSGFSSN
jgi:hypothetical protein